jgi:hypothetical protein
MVVKKSAKKAAKKSAKKSAKKATLKRRRSGWGGPKAAKK